MITGSPWLKYLVLQPAGALMRRNCCLLGNYSIDMEYRRGLKLNAYWELSWWVSSVEPQKLCFLSKGGSLYSIPLFLDKKIIICRSWQLIQNILKHNVEWPYVLRVYLAQGLPVWDLWCKVVVPKPGCRSESSMELKKHRCPVSSQTCWISSQGVMLMHSQV